MLGAAAGYRCWLTPDSEYQVRDSAIIYMNYIIYQLIINNYLKIADYC